MSIGSYSAGEATVAAQLSVNIIPTKPPVKRRIYAKPDETVQPEARCAAHTPQRLGDK